MSWLTATFEFRHEDTRTIHVPKALIIENILDFDHVNYVHRRCYAYCRVVARWHGATLLEYGVRHIPWLPFVTHYTMFHEYHAPDTVVHFARPNGRGPWTTSTMHVSESIGPNGPVTTSRHSYTRILPVWMKPFTPLLHRLVRAWSGILWEEDRAIVERRDKMLRAGFQDSAACARWVHEQGTGAYRFREGDEPAA